ncbi:MAG: glycosyltransferase, partial [candidate division Zixibacteria bacterium]|nr:glycosyltransferase [candidate division Zixibacteria bacterium]
WVRDLGSEHMKILYLTPRFPYPPDRGDKLKEFNLIKYLSKNNSISLLSFAEKKEEDFITYLKDYCEKVHIIPRSKYEGYLKAIFSLFTFQPLQVAYYWSRRMKNLFEDLREKENYDVVLVQLIRMAPYLSKYLGKKVLAIEDAISLVLRRRYQRNYGLQRLVWYLEYLKVRRFERKMLDEFDFFTVVSKRDKEVFKGHSGYDRIFAIPNGVDIDYFGYRSPSTENNNLVFVGNMSVPHNIDAVTFFTNQIFPLIKREMPQVKFYIVGANPHKKVRNLANNRDIFVTGFVEDFRPYLYNAACFVCPLRFGAGIQNKILEAMACGTPVVTTTIGAEGIDAATDDAILIEDDPKDFASGVLDLISDFEGRKNISVKARGIIERNYSWSETVNQLEKLLFKVCHT